MLADKSTTKLFNAGLSLTVCSTILAAGTQLHYYLIFLPHYYGSFANVLRQKPGVNLQPGRAYVKTPAGIALVFLPLAGIFAGLALMKFAERTRKRISEREQKELVEQWMKENTTRKPKSGRSK